MNTYMMILFGGNDEMRELSPEEIQAHLARWRAWMAELQAKGILLGGEPLDGEAKVIRGRQKVISDGPYIEAKEMVSGYLIVRARSLDAAAELSRECPILDIGGSIEVRPVGSMGRM